MRHRPSSKGWHGRSASPNSNPNQLTLTLTLTLTLKAKQQGLARAIGVSHFDQSDLEGILELEIETPAVNQCGMYVGSHDDATIGFCKSKNITYEAYGALRNVDFTNKDLVRIATAHHVSGAAVALRWVTQYGVPLAVSPGLNKEYALEDLGLGSFSLTAAEMATLSAIKGPDRP